MRRVSSDITAPLASHRRLGSVRADTGDARRASAEPRASRRADRAPPTSSCVRRSRRRHAHTRSRVVCAVCRVTPPRLLRCIAGSALSEPTPATPAERAPSRERVVVPDRAAGFAERASIVIRASRVQPQPPRRARRRPPRAQLAAAPHVTAPAQFRANATSARAPPSRERVVVPDRAAGFAERASIVIRASRVQPQPPRRARRRPPRAQLAAAPHVTAPAQFRANTTSARAPPSRERVVVPDRAAGFAERASIVIRASRVQPQPPRRARRRPPRAQLPVAPHVTAPAQFRANTTSARAPPSRERVVVPDRAAGFAERASIVIRASRVQPQPPRRARRRPPRAQLAVAPHVTAPAQFRANTTSARAPPSRERVVVPDRAAGFAERASIVIRASRVQPQPPRRARRRPPRAQLAVAPHVTAPAQFRANTTSARAPPSRERVVVPDRAAGFAERASIVIRASRVQPQPPRRARRRPPRAQLAAAPHVTAPAQFRANTTSARAPPSRERVVVPDRAAGFAERASIVIRASRVQPQPPRRARRRPPRAQLAVAPHVTAPAQFRANTTSARAPPSRERVVVPDRAAGFAERASIVIRASRVQPQPPRRARRRPPRAQLAVAPHVTAPAQFRANTTSARAPPSRERVVVPDRAAGFAERAPIVIRASRVQPQPPRRARRRPPRALYEARRWRQKLLVSGTLVYSRPVRACQERSD